MDRIALIDGDSMVYRAGFAVEKTKYLVETQDTDNGGLTIYIPCDSAADTRHWDGAIVWKRQELGKLSDAQNTIDGWIDGCIALLGVTEYRVLLSPSVGNFREQIATILPYKGNRNSRSRPFYYSDLRDYLISHYQAQVVTGEEADDRLSYAQRSCRDLGIESYVVGHDKDLLQIPGKHYDYVAGELFEITPDQGRMSLWMQVLMGDPGDNVGGCFGIGYQKAKNRIKKWIEEEHLDDLELWDRTIEEYAKSQKKKGCPYAHLDAQDVVEETYWLVRLKQTPNEMNPWTSLITKKTKRTRKTDGKSEQDTETSSSAPSAAERGKYRSASSETKSATIAEVPGK